MKAPELLVAIATDGPILAWHSRTIAALAAVPTVRIVRWDRVVPGHASARGVAAAGARGVVPVPEVLRAIGSVARVAVDVMLDLTTAGVGGLDDDTVETWYFGYGAAGSRDPVWTALLDYIRSPGTSRVALISEPGSRILREGLLTWMRSERVERILLDPSGWPAAEAVRRATPGSRDDGPSNKVAAVHDRAAGIPLSLLKVASVGRRMLESAKAVTREDDWNVGVVHAPIAEVAASGVTQPIAWFPLRFGRFAADPFGVERDDLLHVFFEDYDQREGRGTIAYVAITDDGNVSDPEIIIDAGVHASYPFLVEDDGAVFLLPETSAANELVLYEATDFPRGWRRAATLLAGIPAVDASVVQFDGRWWMFATNAGLGANHNLFVWHAPRLTGPWTPHAANPVKTDARSSRPGGTPFVVDGTLYRPSQDCSVTYGGRLVINRVDVLTPSAFAEDPVASMGPQPESPHRDGLHTLSAAGSYTLVDGKTRHLVPGALQRDVEGRLAYLARRARGG